MVFSERPVKGWTNASLCYKNGVDFAQGKKSQRVLQLVAKCGTVRTIRERIEADANVYSE